MPPGCGRSTSVTNGSISASAMVRRGLSDPYGFCSTIWQWRRTASPICRPSVSVDRASTGGSARRVVPVLESQTRPGELDAWLSSFGRSRSDLGAIETYEHNYVAIEAALTGQGAVVAPLAVVCNQLTRGTLAQTLPEVTVPGPDFAAIYNPRSAGGRHARGFADWLRTLASDTDTPALQGKALA